MIRYRLRCGQGHEFEGWFRDSAAFDADAGASALSCPVCADREIEKAIMAPAVVQQRAALPVPAPATAEPATPAPPDPDPRAARFAQFMLAMRALRTHVEQNFDDVGERFPEEARRIHYGEADPRDIYGRASLDEARELVEEGIGVAPLPDLPELDG